MANRCCFGFKDQMQVVIVRCANIYGYSPSLRFDAVINRFVRQAFFEGRISVEGDGKQLRPFIHIHHAATVFQIGDGVLRFRNLQSC